MPRLKPAQSGLKQKRVKPAINQAIKTRPASVTERAFIKVLVFEYF
ncbi:hypothetical protein [Bartonella apis]